MILHSEDHPSNSGIYRSLFSLAYSIPSIKRRVINKYDYERFKKYKNYRSTFSRGN
ncbi:hypothetical protein [Nanobdella aerobiophila]|uniref:hypothetical protein n=1 Tax=Nanobdella aerobiophila TaxID=2586965 RepID=UPI0021ABDEB6|nr:hypothetical protein [Nanobdella aerobiophila]